MAKILVVDDEPQIERLVLQRFRSKIRGKEYEFDFAQSGKQALEKLAQDKDFEIILTDINMPNMDGLTLISKINENQSDLKIIVVSAYGNMQNIRSAMNLGSYDFVIKPIDFSDLEITINKAIKEIEILRKAKKAQKELDFLQQELTVAKEIQQNSLPGDFSIFAEASPFELYAKMISARDVGGDFYDFFLLDKNQLAIVIGDVSGKGMPAALFMEISKTLLKAIGLKNSLPHKCLEEVNILLSQDNPTNMFTTVFYGVLNLVTGDLDYSNGGHNPPLVVNKDGQFRYLDNCRNMALGIVEDYKYQFQKTRLEPGDYLMLYTDGVPEAEDKNHDIFSLKRLENHLTTMEDSSADAIVNGVIEVVQDFSVGTVPSDDITMMTIKRNISV